MANNRFKSLGRKCPSILNLSGGEWPNTLIGCPAYSTVTNMGLASLPGPFENPEFATEKKKKWTKMSKETKEQTNMQPDSIYKIRNNHGLSRTCLEVVCLWARHKAPPN